MRRFTAAILICLCFATCCALPQPRQKSNKDPVPAGRTISPLEITNICVEGDTVYLQGCPGAIHDSSRDYVGGKPLLRDNGNDELVVKNHNRRRFSLP